MSGPDKIVRYRHPALQHGFTQVPNAILEDDSLSIEARFLWALLAKFAWQDDSCFPGQEGLASLLGKSERTVRSYLRELEQVGLVETRRRGLGQTNQYLLGIARSDRQPASGQTGSQLPTKKTQGEEDSGSSPIKAPPTEHPEFGEWIGHHSSVTGLGVPKRGSQERKKVAAAFGARIRDGFSLADLKLATVGAFEDEFRRTNGHYSAESVLRPTKVRALVEKGRRHNAGGADDAYDRLTVN